MAITLIGPLERRQQDPLSAITTTDPFINTLLTNFNTAQPDDYQPRNPCLDLFFDVVPGTNSRMLTLKLNEVWDHDPLTTLKLICNVRGIRGTGKSDKNGFYAAAIWLHGHHPKTLALNLGNIAEFGYFKDFPEILFRILGLSHTEKMSSVTSYRRSMFDRRSKGKGKVKKSKV